MWQCVCRRARHRPATASYSAISISPVTHSAGPLATLDCLDLTLTEEQIMGKYVLGWFLGVPLIVLVAIYFIAH